MSSRAVGSKVAVRRGGGGWPYVVDGSDMMAGSAETSRLQRLPHGVKDCTRQHRHTLSLSRVTPGGKAKNRQ